MDPSHLSRHNLITSVETPSRGRVGDKTVSLQRFSCQSTIVEGRTFRSKEGLTGRLLQVRKTSNGNF